MWGRLLMKINGNSIRIREIYMKDLQRLHFIDLEEQYMTVPCFFKPAKEKYTEFLKPSLDLIHFRKLCESVQKNTGEKVIFQRNNVEYTDAFLMVNMNEDYSNEDLYSIGIYEVVDFMENVIYVPYKRSSNAAKKGKHLFIRADFFDEMMNWTWLGHSPKKLEDLHLSYVELKAYEALVNSNIKEIVKIAPSEILLLEDKKHPFLQKFP